MFTKARLELTAWYLLIIMFISISFSFLLFKLLTNEVERFARIQRFRIERRIQNSDHSSDVPELIPPPSVMEIPILEPDLVTETKSRIALSLTLINCGILVLAGGLGYFLAGKTLKPIGEMLDDQNRFVSDASHEFRTPLTSMRSAMEVYLREKKPSINEAKQIIKDSLTDVISIQTLSENLLDLTQYHKPKQYIKFEKFELAELIKNVIKTYDNIAKQKEIIIKAKVDSFQIFANEYSIRHLLMILLDNAIKYSSNKGMIEIFCSIQNHQAVLSIKDHGIGIDEKDQLHIFDRFYRSDNARSKTGSGGFGLGLSIAKQIINVHHGSITVYSKLGKGSTFTVVLPIVSS